MIDITQIHHESKLLMTAVKGMSVQFYVDMVSVINYTDKKVLISGTPSSGFVGSSGCK